jgi:hypothetical protein
VRYRTDDGVLVLALTLALPMAAPDTVRRRPAAFMKAAVDGGRVPRNDGFVLHVGGHRALADGTLDGA